MKLNELIMIDDALVHQLFNLKVIYLCLIKNAFVKFLTEKIACQVVSFKLIYNHFNQKSRTEKKCKTKNRDKK